MGDRTSLPAAHSNGAATSAKERRKHRRREPRELVYIDLGPDNCGFILDVSEGGISFKGISSLHDGEILKVRFRLPGIDLSMEAEGQFARPGGAANSSVLKFRGLPDDVRTQIREWVAMTEQEPPASAHEPTVPAVPPVPAMPALPASSPRLFERPVPASFEPPMPVASDGISPVSSLLAQAIAKNSEAAGLSADPHPDALDALALRISSNPRRPPAAAEKPPMAANLPATPPVSLDQPEKAAVKSAEWPNGSFELTIRPAPRASASSDAAASGSGKHPHAAKGYGFTAGIVVGCVVLASVGGGLIATGRLHLAKPTSPTGIAASAAPSGSNADAGAARTGSQAPRRAVASPSGLITAPAPPASAPAKAQTPPLKAVPAGPPSAAASPRKESVRKGPIPKEIVEKQPAAPSKASTAHAQNTTPAAAATEAVSLLEAPRTLEPAGSIRLDMSRPVEQTHETPASANAQTPSLPTGVTQPLPELGSDTPATVSQVAATPAKRGETFASPQMEEKPAPTKRTVKAPQPSASVFAAPDPNGAKPSSVDPAKLVLYVEPAYPAAARAAKIQGNVDVLATIGKDGVPRALEAVNGDPGLAAAAIAAISNWRYRPATLNGQPEESLITITLKFAL